MKVIIPNQLEYTIELIPRYYDLPEVLTFEFYDESNRVSEYDDSNVFSVINGVLSWGFRRDQFDSISFSEGNTIQLTISDSNEIIYRGKILCTSQTTQDFKLTDGLYTYN